MRATLTKLFLAAALVASACAEKDVTAPPAPRIDPFKSPTSADTITITGTAEYNSTVRITGGAKEVSVTADPFTATFRAEVPLNKPAAPEISLKNQLSATATDAAGNTSEATAFEVVFGPEPGKPAKITFDLDGKAASGTINAGDEVKYKYSLTDAYGAKSPNPVEVLPSAPGALVFDDGVSGNGFILGMTKVGSFTIAARATGVPADANLSKTVTVEVQPALGKRFIDMQLTLSRMATGDSTSAIAVVKDLYGNEITPTTGQLTLACDPQGGQPASACAVNGTTITVTKSGVYKITATFNDGTNPAAPATQYVFVEDVPDVTPPTCDKPVVVYPSATGAKVPLNGRIVVQLPMFDAGGLAQATLYAVFGNNPACVQTSRTLQLAGVTNPTPAPEVSITVPGCAYPLDSISLFAVVTDRAGNMGFSPANNDLSVIGTQLGQNGYTATTFGYANNQNGGSLDLAFDPNTQVAYVVSSNWDSISVVLSDRTRTVLRDATGQTYQANNNTNNNGLMGIAVDGTGGLLVSAYSSSTPTGNDLNYISTSLPVDPKVLASYTYTNGPGRLVYDQRPGVVCVARTSFNSNFNCYEFNTSTQTLGAKIFTNDIAAPGNPQLAGLAIGEKDSNGYYTLWMLVQVNVNTCAVYTTTATFTANTAPAPVALALSPAVTGTCNDIVGLPSGDVAVAVTGNNSGEVVRVTKGTGATTPLVTGLTDPTGLDFAGGFLYVIDRNNRQILQVTAPVGAPF